MSDVSSQKKRITIFNNASIRCPTQWNRACDKIAPEMKLASEAFLPPAHIYPFFFCFRIKEGNLLTCDYASEKNHIAGKAKSVLWRGWISKVSILESVHSKSNHAKSDMILYTLLSLKGKCMFCYIVECDYYNIVMTRDK